MKFVWSNEKNRNERLCFSLTLQEQCHTLSLCAADFYQVFLDGRFVAYGPQRAAAGYTRPIQIDISEARELVVKVLGYNVPCYACDFQQPFFGAEIRKNGEVVYETTDFSCARENARIQAMPRYSRQRGFAEGYDFTKTGKESAQTVVVVPPTVLENGKDRSLYKRIDCLPVGQGVFEGFAGVRTAWWSKNPAFAAKPDDFDISRDFLDRVKGDFYAFDYQLPEERTGFIGLTVSSETESQIAVVFDEFLPDGEWTFGRGQCNDYVYLKVPAGKTEFLSAEPYALKYVKVICGKGVTAVPHIVTYENDFAPCVRVIGDGGFEKIFQAAENTFRQNAVDVFTDCPGRERAGWLCDAYFTAKAERFFTGKNEVEKSFLENFLLAKTEELPEGMLPMCFPSEHDKGSYIPNWAMWFAIEVEDYFQRTGDRRFVELLKDKIYAVLTFFEKYRNEFGLLENLESWVFIEWSVCNDKEYVKGVNFPSNMLYAYMLEKVGALYGDEGLVAQSRELRAQILAHSFNGEFFVDNAVRIEGKLTVCQKHISETCQYYALFTGFCPTESYRKRMIESFGPLRKEGVYPAIGKSNMFIGNYLRFFYLLEQKEYDRVLTECLEYFKGMAEKTGTLWEHDQPSASCNHGFASVAAAILATCVCGYQTVKDGRPIFKEGFTKKASDPIFTFAYNE